MRVAVGKTRKHKAAFGVDHFGGFSAIARNVPVGSDGQQFPIANGQCLCPGLFWIHRVDAGVDENGAWENGEPRIREMERSECAKQVERLTKTDTQLSNRQSAVCYLPVWLYNYTYQSKQFRWTYTGKVDHQLNHDQSLFVRVASAPVIPYSGSQNEGSTLRLTV